MNKRHTKLMMTTRKCMICGNTFVPFKANHSYCSDDCRAIVREKSEFRNSKTQKSKVNE